MHDFIQSAYSLYLSGFSVPPFFVVTAPAFRVAFGSPAHEKLHNHFISAGGLQTDIINFRFTPFWSAFAFSPCTTGFCLFQSASWVTPRIDGGNHSFLQIVIPRSLITLSPHASFQRFCEAHQTSLAPKNPKPSIV